MKRLHISVRSVLGSGLLAAGLVGFLAGVGCAGLARSSGEAQTPGLDAHIRVLTVEARQGYVILECFPMLPAGTGVLLYRDGKVVAKVALTSATRPGLVAADVVSGEPKAGDEGRALPVQQESVKP